MPVCLLLLQDRVAVCQLPSSEPIPGWAMGGAFLSVTRTAGELSVVCPAGAVPTGTKCETGWRVFQVEGPLDFGLTGILASLAQPLADAKISIFALSTYNTDYVMVKEENMEQAVQALTAAGHTVSPHRE